MHLPGAGCQASPKIGQIMALAQLRLLVLQCRSMIQRDWSQEDSTSNKMRMHTMILLLLSTSMNDDADKMMICRCRFPTLHRCGAGHETGCRHTILCPALHSLDSYALLFQPIVALLTGARSS
jgi:hypothetical protein